MYTLVGDVGNERGCACMWGVPGSSEWINENTVPFEDFDKVRIDKERNLYSNRRNFKNGQYEKLNYKEKKDGRLFFLYDENGKRVRRYL